MKKFSRKTLSLFLSATLFLQFFVVQALAQSVEDIPQQTEQAVESTPGPDIASEPSETVSTVPPQEVPEQVVEPTSPETEPSSAEPDVPTGQPDASPISIADAIAASSNSLPMLIQGTVIYSADTYVVIEDDTGGMVIAVDNSNFLTPGDYIEMLIQFNGTFTSISYENIGTAPLPMTEVSLSDVPENRHISLTQITIEDGILTQDSASVPLATTLPQGMHPAL